MLTNRKRTVLQVAIVAAMGLLLAWRYSTLQRDRATALPDVAPSGDATTPTYSGESSGPKVDDGAESPGIAPPLTGMSSGAAGRVYDERTGNGLAGAQVSARRMGVDAELRLETDAEGGYAFGDLAAGNWQLSVTGRGVPPGRHVRYVSLREGEARGDVDFALTSDVMGVRISGEVTDPEGSSVEGASVQSLGRGYHQTSTDARGLFTLAGLQVDSETTITAWKEGYGPSEPVRLAVGEKDIDGLHLKLHREASISGIVVDPKGRAVTDARVIALGSISGRIESAGPNTDSAGTFRIGGLGPGKYEIRAERYRQPSSFSSGMSSVLDAPVLAELELREGQHEGGLRLVLPDDGVEYGIVSGTVLALDETPMAGTLVVLENSRYQGSAATDADGSFALSVPVGMYMGRVSAAGYVTKFVPEVESPATGVRIVLEHVGRIRGTVFDRSTREPITQFLVAQTVFDDMPAAGNLDLVAHYDARGVFYAPAAPQEVTRLAVTAPGYALMLQSVTVPPGESVDVEFLLEPGASLNGMVVDGAGRPLAGAQVFAGDLPKYWQPNGGSPERAACFTGPGGEFYMDSLPLTVKEITALMPGYRLSTANVALVPGNNGPVTLRLAAGARIVGQVALAERPVFGAPVSLHITEPAYQDFDATAGDAGEFEFTGVMAGTGTVGARVDLDDGWSYRMTRPIRVGQRDMLDLRLDMASSDTLLEGRVTGRAADVSRTEVRCRISSDGGMDEMTVPVGDGGDFTISGMPEGAALVSVSAFRESRADVLRQTVEVVNGQIVHVNFDFGALCRISGTLAGWVLTEKVAGAVVEGEVSPPNSVEAFNAWFSEQPVVEVFEVQPDGSFSVGVPSPGTYTVILGTEGPNGTDPRAVSTVVEAMPGEAVSLDLSL